MKAGHSFFVRRKHLIFTIAVLVIFSWLFYQAALLYVVWEHNPTSQYFLPPHQSIGYFAEYVGFRIFSSYFISLVFGLFFLFLAKQLNRKYGERFFEQEEPYFLALSLFLAGHPGWLVYLIAVFVVYFLFHVIYALFMNRTDRLPFYSFWLPTALFVILLNEFWFQQTELWSLLGFGKLG